MRCGVLVNYNTIRDCKRLFSQKILSPLNHCLALRWHLRYVKVPGRARRDGRTGLPTTVIRDGATGVYERALASEARRLRLDFVFSYQPVPGTVIFAGYGNRLLDRDDRGLRRESDGFFLKLSYLFRM